jgi:sigma-54-interacting transcriptional regulator
MENQMDSSADANQPIFAADGIGDSRAYWPLAQAAHIDLQLVRHQRVNLLLMGPESAIQAVMTRLEPELREPIRIWTAPDPLELPVAAQTGTFILRGVDALLPADQRRLLEWLHASWGHTQVISTTSARLLTRATTGGFLDALYYRLNIVCVDLTT